MTFLWIVLGILAYIGVALALGRFIAGRGLARLRDELFEDALPCSATGDRTKEQPSAPGRLEWTEVTNLSADHGRSRATISGGDPVSAMEVAPSRPETAGTFSSRP